MSQTPVGGHPQGWEHKLADRSSLPPASGEERSKSHTKHVFSQPFLPKGAMLWREETEGSSASSARSPASPPYLRWARSLQHLLEDGEGVRLFRKFVSGAGRLHVERLNFYFVVAGLRHQTEPSEIRHVVYAIYKFLRKSQLTMPEDLKQRVKQSLKDGSDIDNTIFDEMEREVTRAITETTYQAFLRSEAYVSYVSAATQPLSSPDDPPAAVKEPSCGGLATLHEGEEVSTFPAARLTHDALLASQTRRLHCDPPPRSWGVSRSVYTQPSSQAHLTYGGYCPTSRHSSGRASRSSGRTDSDAMSASGSSLDGMSLRRAREPRHRRHDLDRHAVINKEPEPAMMIPRTQRMQSEQLRVLPPSEFAPLLIEKLERVKREQEVKERLERRLAEGDGEDASSQTLPPQLIAAAIREKLQVEDDNDQDILDQHVSRVWSEPSPLASPPPRRPRPALSAASRDSGLYDTKSDLSQHASHLRRSFSKKTVTDDSGVSVVSSSRAASSRLLQWIADGEREGAAGGGGGGGGSSSGGRRHVDSSRASSAERDEPRRSKGNKTKAVAAPAAVAGGKPGPTEPCTVVVVALHDDSVPYRLRVPHSPLTLATFKDYLPRKGNYRYFFKTECADLDNTVIQEEISNDNDILPMFEGKVMARVKSID